MLGGLQVLRAHSSQDFEDPNLSKNILHTMLPWNWGCSCRVKKLCFGLKKTNENGGGNKEQKMPAAIISTEDRQRIWRKRVDFNAFVYVGFLLALTFAQLGLDINFNKGKMA